MPTANLDEGLRGVNWALLVGSIPRKADMERKDLLGINGKIFISQGKAIEKNGAADARILGSEAAGLTAAWHDPRVTAVSIPMRGIADSQIDVEASHAHLRVNLVPQRFNRPTDAFLKW